MYSSRFIGQARSAKPTPMVNGALSSLEMMLLTFVNHEPASMLKRFTSETVRPLPASHAS